MRFILRKFHFLLPILTLLLLLPASVFAKPVISSDSNYFDINTGRYILDGNVYVKTGDREIRAEHAQVSIVSLEVWGQGGVTVTQGDILFTGDTVYVSGRNKSATISGGIDFERTALSIKAESVVFNWGTKIAEFSGNISVNDHGNAYTADTLRYDIRANQIL